MKKSYFLVFLITCAVTNGFIYIGKCIGRDESRSNIENLEHRIDSLQVENKMLQNDVLFWKTKYELNEDISYD